MDTRNIPNHLGFMVLYDPIYGLGPAARWVTKMHGFGAPGKEKTSLRLASAFPDQECYSTNPGLVQVSIPLAATIHLAQACRETGAVLDLTKESRAQIEGQYLHGKGAFALPWNTAADAGAVQPSERHPGLTVFFNSTSQLTVNMRPVTGMNGFKKRGVEQTSFVLRPVYEGNGTDLANPDSVHIRVPMKAVLQLVQACKAAGAALNMASETRELIERQYGRKEGIFAPSAQEVPDRGILAAVGVYGGGPGFH